MFDAGSVISLTQNNLLWLLRHLKKIFGGKFLIPISVKKELIDKPLETFKFKFEALQVMRYIRKDVIDVVKRNDIELKAKQILELANHCFKARGNWINVLHQGETEVLAAAKILGSSAIVIDERTTRYLLEDVERLRLRMEHKLHTKVVADKNNLKELKKELKGLTAIRSVELIAVAYEHGLLDDFIPNKTTAVPDPRAALLDSILWGLKTNGCSISVEDLNYVVQIEKSL